MRNIEKENEKIAELRIQFESQGYRVLVEPKPEDLPFEMLDYRPDLIATKGNGGIIVEVKTSMKRAPISKFQEISELISQHNGWKFVLVTLDDPLSSSFDTIDIPLLGIDAIKDRFSKLETLLELDMLSPAILEAWSLIEGCLRILAEDTNIPVTFLQPSRLINYLYSEGEISMQQTDELKELMKYRNMVAHGMGQNATRNIVEKFIEALSNLIRVIGPDELTSA